MKEDMIRSLGDLLNLEIITETVVIVFLTWLVLLGIRRLSAFLADRFPRRRVQISSIFPVLRLAAWIGAIAIIVTSVIRPQLNTLFAIAATVGVALGLGAQELVKNVLAGVMILLDRPFRVGDMVRVDTYYGEVTHIGLRTIRLHTFDDSTIILPNGLFLNKAVSNSNSGALVEQVVVEFFLPGNVPIRDVKELMHEAALCSPYVFRKNPVDVLVEDRFDYGFLSLFKVKAYVMDVRFERLMASDITERVKEAIHDRGLLPKECIFPLPAFDTARAI